MILKRVKQIALILVTPCSFIKVKHTQSIFCFAPFHLRCLLYLQMIKKRRKLQKQANEPIKFPRIIKTENLKATCLFVTYDRG